MQLGEREVTAPGYTLCLLGRTGCRSSSLLSSDSTMEGRFAPRAAIARPGVLALAGAAVEGCSNINAVLKEGWLHSLVKVSLDLFKKSTRSTTSQAAHPISVANGVIR